MTASNEQAVMTVLREVPEEEGMDEETVEGPIVDGLRKEIVKLRRQEEVLRNRAINVGNQLRRYERALNLLQEPQPPAKTKTTKATKRSNDTRMGAEKLNRIREVVLKYAETHEEFRQVDIRGLIDINSSASAVAFESLRQENLIRVARRDGNSKYYRLTHEALNEVSNG